MHCHSLIFLISKVLQVFILIFIVAVLPSASSADVRCEAIGYVQKFELGSKKTCFMESTLINTIDFSITSDHDEYIEGFYANQNKQLAYLPKNLGEKFPNLAFVDAQFCLIIKITRESFKGLSKLRILNLWNNQIEKIYDNTFEYTPELEWIHLEFNKIKKLNGRAFASLSKLALVDLSHNECIDGNFDDAAEIAELPQIVTSKCGFTEAPKACGVPKKATPTIAWGESFDRGDFPWMVALFRRLKQRRAGYFCGAAHCLKGLTPRDIAAVFGAYDLVDHSEVGRFVQSPSKIFVHDQWDPRTTQFDADIAMLLLPQKIVFSTFVQPVCLWDSDDVLSTSHGVIAGWGQSQNTSRDHETIPTKLQLPIHNNEDCFLTHPQLAQISTNQTFCAGSADGRGPCHGDSGGGFYVSVENVSFLRGIVSAAWDVNIYGECLLKMYTIYTDVPKFRAWIDDIMQQN